MRIVTRVTALLTIICAFIDSGYAQTNNDCELGQFQCHDGDCIAGQLMCDGRAHCKDKSDETEEECMRPEVLCPKYAFRCKYGACVNGDAACNGIQECLDNSDETQPQCPTDAITNQTEKNARCTANQFACANTQCIRLTDVCDGIKNCADGSDEVSTICQLLPCPPTAFRCAYGACINGDLRCNGVADCADESDEDTKLCGPPVWSPLPPIKPTPRPTPRPPVKPGTRTSCDAPPQPPNGRWRLHESQCTVEQDCAVQEGMELQLGSRLVYSCNPGFNIRGIVDVSCSHGGVWLNIPVCIEIRCKALSTSSTRADCFYLNDRVSCGSPVLPGTTAAVGCRNSYQRETNLLTRQSDYVRCNPNGQWDPDPIKCVPVCGILPANYKPLIVNGTAPNITEFPWHASLYNDVSGTKEYFCGSSIIQDNLLITAAHCVYDTETRRPVSPDNIYVATGNIYRDYDFPLHNPRFVKKGKVKNIYMMCNYLGDDGNHAWDIAILELVKPFVLSTLLVPICIDSNSDEIVLEAGVLGNVAGFGRTAYGETSGILQSLEVPFIPHSQCKTASQATRTEQFITMDKFCAGYTNGSAICDGDSGGGLVFQTGDLWYLRGIVSVSLNTIKKDGNSRCDPNLYTLYTRVFSHIGWIQDVILRLERRKSYPLCPDRS